LKNIKNLLQKPSRKSKPWAIWIWNFSITMKELEFQLNSIIDKGFGGVAIRPGRVMTPAFLSDEFCALFMRVLQIAKEKDIGVRLAEDFSLPYSGQMQTLISQNSSFRAQKLSLVHSEILTTNAGFEKVIDDPENTLVFYARQKDGKIEAGKGIKALPFMPGKNSISWKAPSGEWRIMIFKKSYAQSVTGEGFLPNVYNPKVSLAWISNVCETIKSRFGRYFPTTFEGFITEMPPLFPADGSVPWDDDLVVKYRSKYKRDLIAHLPSLFFDVDPREVKNRSHIYRFMVQQGYDQFASSIEEWCKKSRLSHWLLCPERTVQSTPGVFRDLFMAPEGRFGATGAQNLDWVEENLVPLKAMADANANVYRRQTIAILGRNRQGYGASLQDLKSEADHHVFIGQSAMVVDGLFFNIDHRSAVKSSFNPFWYSREWEFMQCFCLYAGRLHELSADLYTDRQVAVLMPSASLAADFLPGSSEQFQKGIGNLQKTLDELKRHNLNFDVISDEFLLSCSVRTTGDFGTADRLRKGNYQTLILPYARLLDKNVFVFLEKLAVRGGTVVFIDELPQGCLDEGISSAITARAEKLLKTKRGKVHAVPLASLSNILDGIAPPAVAYAQGRRCPDIQISHRSDGPLNLYQVYNASDSQEYAAQLELPAGKYFYAVDCKSGSIHEIPDAAIKDGKGVFSIALQPRLSCVIIGVSQKLAGIPAHKEKPHPMNELSTMKKSYRLVLRNQWKFSSESLNVLPLASWNTRIGLSRESGGYSHYYETYFEVKEAPPACVLILQNNLNLSGTPDDSMEITCNGNKIEPVVADPAPPPPVAPGVEVVVPPDLRQLAARSPMLRTVRCYNLRPFVAKGFNRIALRTASPYNDPPVILYPPLVAGDFSIEKGSKGWIISSVSPLAGTDSWTEYGYPYLSGVGVYNQVFEVPSEYKHLILKFGRLSGSAEVFVNGNRLVTLHCPPFEVDITAACTVKRNELTVKVMNSLDNVVKMSRRASGLTGEVYVDVY